MRAKLERRAERITFNDVSLYRDHRSPQLVEESFRSRMERGVGSPQRKQHRFVSPLPGHQRPVLMHVGSLRRDWGDASSKKRPPPPLTCKTARTPPPPPLPPGQGEGSQAVRFPPPLPLPADRRRPPCPPSHR